MFRIGIGIALGASTVIALQACCGDLEVFEVEPGTYSANISPTGLQNPDLAEATLRVTEAFVTLEYVTEDGQTGDVEWHIEGALDGGNFDDLDPPGVPPTAGPL
jgi:hypothetical protein